jgi:transcriptional regulator with XRE-family HTH domain
MIKSPNADGWRWPYGEQAMAGRPSSSEPPPFGKRLIELRKNCGLAQGEFAEILGVTPQTVEYYERRAKNPSLDLLLKLAAALNVTVSELVGDAPARRMKPGPPSELEERIEKIRRLPRKEQEVVIRMLDGVINSARPPP